MLTYLRNYREVIRKCYVVFMLLMNVLSLILGMLYITREDNGSFWNVYGFILLISLFGNIGLAAIEKHKTGLSILYLSFSSLFLMAVALINTAVSNVPDNHQSQSTVSAALIFALVILGGAIAAESLQYRSLEAAIQSKGNPGDLTNQTAANSYDNPSNVKVNFRIGNIVKYVFIILLSAVLYFGLFLAVNMLRVHKTGLLEVFISEYALFLSIIFLGVGVLILKLLDKRKYSLYYGIVFAATIIVTVICLLPFLSIPALLKNAKENYDKAFMDKGVNTTDNTDTLSEYLYPETFRKLPFSLPEYFFGISSKQYQVKENVLFYEGTEGVDKGLKLYFDVYSPMEDGKNLPGANSILIRIHGGGWTSGDKGTYNFAQMNKYFAAQGYIVFDIEYGLNNIVDWINFDKVRASMAGNFTINDMVRHIGIFTDYLVRHNTEYNGNLKSVFISGGSAGGQLALASGLAIADGGYQNIFNPKITVKGIIPFYPANGLSTEIGIGGNDEFVDPSALVTKNSPPCLIYQGNHDGLVSHKIADSFRNTYLEKGNSKCAVLTMPYGSHGSDLYFAGYYNQVFLYYMERFMYQYQ